MSVKAHECRRLRIAFLVTNFPKLSEIFLLNQALALLDRGHEVHIHALTDPGEARVQPGTERLLGQSRVHVAGMPRGALARLRALPGLVARNGLARSLRCLNPLRHGAEAITLRNLFRLDSVRDQPLDYDVVHAQLGSVARQCVMLRQAGLLRAPLICSFRGSDLSRYVAHGMPGAYDAVFREASYCLPVAERWIATLVDLGCPRAKIHHLPSGIPMARIPRRSQEGWGENRDGKGFPRIVSACRLERYKGLHLGLEAFRLLIERCPDAHYAIFGDGPERPALERQAERLGIAQRITWHGAAHHDEILGALAQVDIHWFTTITLADGRTEGVPNILKETQAAGIPAVAFDHPGVAEVVLPGETGMLVPEGDATTLAEATARLAGDGAMARQMGELAARRARQTFDLDLQTDRLEALYFSAAAGSAHDSD